MRAGQHKRPDGAVKVRLTGATLGVHGLLCALQNHAGATFNRDMDETWCLCGKYAYPGSGAFHYWATPRASRAPYPEGPRWFTPHHSGDDTSKVTRCGQDS